MDEAEDTLQKALELKPNDTGALLDYANTLNMYNQPKKALQWYYKILEISPGNLTTQYNIAYTLKKLGRIDEALKLYNKVIEKHPDYIEAHFSRGLAYLTSGDFDRGWLDYEWRWKKDAMKPRTFSKPQWDGSDLTGKTILLHAEQGLGDTFQFIRYAHVVKTMGARVIAAVQKPLIIFYHNDILLIK